MGRSVARREGRDPRATRERILDAALDVFARHGYHEATVDDIVAASDSSKGGFYFHFPSKDGVFLALVDSLARRLEAKVERAIAQEATSVARVDAALRTVLEVFARHRRLARVLLLDVPGLKHVLSKRYLEVRSRFARLIQVHLEEAVRDGSLPPVDTALTAVMWMGAVNEVVVHWLYTGQPRPLTAALPQVRALLLRSVGLPPVAEPPAPG